MVSTTDGIKIATATASNLNFANGITITGDSVSTGGGTQGGAIAGTTTLTAGDSGTWYTIAQTSNYNINLPNPPVAGIWYKFILKTTGNFAVLVNALASTMYGTIINDVTSVIGLNSVGGIQFVPNTAAIGDTIEVYGIDSTTYLIKSITNASGGIDIPI